MSRAGWSASWPGRGNQAEGRQDQGRYGDTGGGRRAGVDAKGEDDELDSY